jgi:flagellar motor protein MotB
VAKDMARAGIEAKRLVVEGLGETELLVPDDTEDNKQRNRRIEFVILKE